MSDDNFDYNDNGWDEAQVQHCVCNSKMLCYIQVSQYVCFKSFRLLLIIF